MRYAIIAAGIGERLAHEGVTVPKPLVRIGNETLIDRLIRMFMDNNAEEIVVICNDKNNMVNSHLDDICTSGLNGKAVPLKYVVKSTPSSLHSFHELCPLLSDGKFVLTTVDTVFCEKDFAGFISDFEKSDADGCFPVTDYIDDESPLYVGVDDSMYITGFYDEQNGYRYVSAGIYGLDTNAKTVAQRCIEQGKSRMRNFQRALVSEGFKIKICPFAKVFDIDHVEDIRKAEDFLLSNG
ncbi:MAG: NTP transferase domain-containing protein [Prevotella sp.]|uniref:nucleotidyltransferase family protein n=1 Tax=Prevotella sp. TaxID=59823 RepID=UPI002A2E4E03|nr:sugar phosphate nucleotidyltransferase [Prevotella sp.]MDD7319156.1 NTP transferase domain-containing protein [Prevotellaceae bacterium]MDY4020024.1 NTP transferase domain-containing protein [Prevotella sp.]